MSKVALLLSGGMDSIALAYWKRPELAITINYGQKPFLAELNASKEVARVLGMEHIVLDIDCSSLGSGIMSDKGVLSMAPTQEWWPYRNQLLVTLAAMEAIHLGVNELMLGTVKTDSIHKDGTKSFYDAIDSLMTLQEGSIRITAPAINMTTEELIRVSRVPESVLLWAHSCHISNQPCGTCPGCIKYREVRRNLGIE